MKFLVELDHPKTGQRLDAAAARAFVEDVVFPTLDRAEALVSQGCILAGGPVAGSVALRFIAEVESARHLDDLVSSLPLWSVAYTRVTPLIEFSDRRPHLRMLLQQRVIPLADESHARID
jgi:muconolactone delta-isomerase